MCKAIYKSTDNGYETVNLNSTIEQVYELVGKHPEAVKLGDNVFLIREANAMENGESPNEYIEVVRPNGTIEGFMVCGNFLIAKANFDRDMFDSFTGEEIDNIVDMINDNRNYWARQAEVHAYA